MKIKMCIHKALPKVAISLMLFWLAGITHAGVNCTLTPTSGMAIYGVSGTYTVVNGSSTPIGGSLGTYTFSSAGGAPGTIVCSSNGVSTSANNLVDMSLAYQTQGGPVSGQANMYYLGYNTSIGYKISYNGTVISNSATSPTRLTSYGSPVNVNIIQGFPPGSFTIQLFKLSESLSGSSGSTSVASAYIETSPGLTHGGAGGREVIHLNFSATLSVVSPTCTVNTGNITINLGNVNASVIGAVGATSPISSPQNVSLNCSGSPSVTMSMGGAQASGGPNTVLALTGTSSATGVGVQLLYNNNPLVLNASNSISTGASATLTVPISARYYRTGNLSVGSANANATLNFTYN
jgi:type 1 fimbria pilin